MTTTKKELRPHFKQQLAAALVARPALGDKIVRHVLAQAWGHSAIVALYWSHDGEMPTHELCRQLAQRHVIALPRIDDGIMTFRQWETDHALEPDGLGLLAPRAAAPVLMPAIIIAPLLAYDDWGNRLGRGGGFYDRAIATFPDALAIGLACTAQHSTERLPTESHDRRLALVITEQGVITPKA